MIEPMDIDLSALDEALSCSCHGAMPVSDLGRLLDLEVQDVLSITRLAQDIRRSRDEARRSSMTTPVKPLAEVPKAPQGSVALLLLAHPDQGFQLAFEMGCAFVGMTSVVCCLEPLEDEESQCQRALEMACSYGSDADLLVARGFSHWQVEQLQDWATMPVHNGGSELFDPLWGLSVALTLLHERGLEQNAAGRMRLFASPQGPFTASFLELAALMGWGLDIVCPQGLGSADECLEECQELLSEDGASWQLCSSNDEGGSDALCTLIDVTGPWRELVHDPSDHLASAALWLGVPESLGLGVSDDELVEMVWTDVMSTSQNLCYVLAALLLKTMGVA